MGVKISLQDLVYTYFRYMPSSEIVGSYDKSIFNFWELSILLSIAAALYYNPINKQCISVLISPYLHQHWYILGFFFEFLILIFEFFLYCAGWGYIVFLNLHTLLWGASLWQFYTFYTFFFCSTEGWTLGSMLIRQASYHLSQPFCYCCYFCYF
jgi:hypothetical protein